MKLFNILLCIALSVAGCNSTQYTSNTDNKPDQKIKLDVKTIHITGVNSLNTYCDAQSDTCPKNELLKWIDRSIKAVGEKGTLLITVNNALLHRLELQNNLSSYQGLYDINFKLIMDEDSSHNYLELNVIAENYTDIPYSINKKDKAAVIKAQIAELISLLREEMMQKAKVHFIDYLK